MNTVIDGPIDPRLGRTSASNAEADYLCPGRHNAIKAVKSVLIRDDADASFGDAVHAALAAGDPKLLDKEQLKTYEMCQQVEADILSRYFGLDAAEAIKKVWRHRRFWGVFGGHEHSGEVDVLYRHHSKALIIEYKTLFGDIPAASSNRQLRDQVVLANEHFLLLEEIATAVDQPHITLKPEICVYKREDIVKAKAEITERVIASNTLGSPLIPGEVQCKFCVAKPLCKAYAIWMSEKLPLAPSLTQVPMKEWTPEQWALFCGNMTAAYEWLEAGKAEAKAKLKENPESIPGFFLRDGQKVRHVVKPNILFGRFLKLGGEQEHFMNCVEIALGHLEQELRLLTNAKGKGLDKAMEALLSGLIEIEERGPSIARKKD